MELKGPSLKAERPLKTKNLGERGWRDGSVVQRTVLAEHIEVPRTTHVGLQSCVIQFQGIQCPLLASVGKHIYAGKINLKKN